MSKKTDIPKKTSQTWMRSKEQNLSDKNKIVKYFLFEKHNTSRIVENIP